MKRTLVFFFLIALILTEGCTGGGGGTIEGNRYYNRSWGFSIGIPEGWKESNVSGAVVGFINPEKTARVNVIVQRLPEGVTLQKYRDRVSSQVGASRVRKVNDGKMLIDGADAYWSIMVMTVEGKRFKSLNYYTMKGRTVYTIICTVDADNFDDSEAVFDSFAVSFRFEQ